MPLLREGERRFLTAVARLAYCNPFLPERIEFERAALGPDYEPASPIWSASVTDPEAIPPNLAKLRARLGPVVERIRTRIAGGASAQPEELLIYEASAQYFVYERYYPRFSSPHPNWRFYDSFAADWDHFFFRDSSRFESALYAAHMFACYKQVQQAFFHIFYSIIGNSMPAARLRADVWQSVFTHDLQRYGRSLFP